MSDGQAEPGATPAGDPEPSLDTLTEEILPALLARLRTSRLGEIEVRADGWRVRLRRAPVLPTPPGVTTATATGREHSADGGSEPSDAGHSLVRSPAVGYVSLGSDLAVGRSVQAGDSLGSVDVLGIRQDVAAPTDGVISRVLVENDQAVEYGQVLAHIDELGLDLVGGKGPRPVADEDPVEGGARDTLPSEAGP